MTDYLFPHCRTCVNREFDPYECESCDYGSNYEPDLDAEDDDYEDSNVLTIDELRDLLLLEAA